MSMEYHNRFKELDSQYDAWKILHKDIQDFILPRRGNFVERGKPYDPVNVARSSKVINDAATRANRILGSGMQGGLTSPSRRWFELGLQDDDLGNFAPVKEWLMYAARVMYKVYRSSNFYTEVHRVFEEQGGFGTSPLIQEEDYNTVVHFTTLTAGEYRLANNAKGIADTVYRHYWESAQNLVKMYGSKCTNAVQKAAKRDKSPFEYFEVIHAIEPREDYDPEKIDSLNMPYRSVVFEYQAEDGKILRESGYMEKPHAIPRWTAVGNSPYGLGPGHDCLGNVKMLQSMEKSSIKAVHKSVDPPLSIPSHFKEIVSQLPGAANYSNGDGKITSLYDIRFDVEKVEFKIDKIEQRIERTFYNDIFSLITNAEKSIGRNITATEILERKQEKMILLGPTIERQMFELLTPVVERTFNACLRRGLFPPVPEELEDQELKINYISVLAQAQQLADAQSMEAYSIQVERAATFDETVVHKTDWEEYLEQYSEIVGVPPKIVRSKEEFAEIKQWILDQQADAAEAERQQAEAESMRNLGQSNTEGTALGEMMQQ